jgi:choline dehydrogenase
VGCLHPHARGAAFPIGSKFYDWKYESEPEPFMNGRKIYHARGKVLGGSSSINGMIFQRGNPLDYERWAADPGMETWDYAHCLPYFKKMENCLAATATITSAATAGRWSWSEGLRRTRCSGLLRGSPGSRISDHGRCQRLPAGGFAKFDRNVRRGRRLSAARAYLHPVMHRKNLTVTTRALVHRVLFDGTRATGVEFSRPPRWHPAGDGG